MHSTRWRSMAQAKPHLQLRVLPLLRQIAQRLPRVAAAAEGGSERPAGGSSGRPTRFASTRNAAQLPRGVAAATAQPSPQPSPQPTLVDATYATTRRKQSRIDLLVD